MASKEHTSIYKMIDRGSIGEEESIVKVVAANVYDHTFQAPYLFSALSERYKGFSLKNEVHGLLEFDFEHKEHLKKDPSGLEVLCGKTSQGHPLVMNEKQDLLIRTPKGDLPLGSMFDLMNIDRSKVPVEGAELKIMGQQIPVGLVLARALGFRGLLKLLKPTYRVQDGRERVKLGPDEYVIAFEDRKFIFSRRDEHASLILGGLLQFQKQLKNHQAEVFDRKEIYDYLLESLGCTAAVAKELDHVENAYVDPISKRLLEKMGEPQTFLGLLTRAASELTHYNTPLTQDLNHQQIRGYERIPGLMHKELYKAIRTFKTRRIGNRSKIDMGHFAVWTTIQKDKSVKTCEDINPIQNLKMHESITFVGEGGRSKDTFMKNDRAYNHTDIGVVSGDSVDSGDVGINIFMAANPLIEDVTGIKKKTDQKLGPGNYLSTTELLMTGTEYDD